MEKLFTRYHGKRWNRLCERNECQEFFYISGDLDEGAKTRICVDSGLSAEFEVKLGMHHGSVLSDLLFPVGVDVMDVLSELLYAVDLVLMS